MQEIGVYGEEFSILCHDYTSHLTWRAYRSEVVCLLPVLIVLYVGAPSDGMRAPAWNATLLFGGQDYALRVLMFSYER